MAEFKNFADFFKQINKDIDVVLKKDTSPQVVGTLIMETNKEVYGRYKPVKYKRRYDMKETKNWKSEVFYDSSLGGHNLAIYSTVKPFGAKGYTTNKYLPDLIEMGQKQYTSHFGVIGYDFVSSKNKGYLRPRRFAGETVKMLNHSGKNIVSFGLSRMGYKLNGYTTY